ncbi:glutamate racemase, partial [Limosilactobacillus fermentum]
MDNRPIGVMDSGLGGLSVVRVIQQKLPNEEVIFVGDQGHFPYGTKDQAEVRQLALSIGSFLLKHDVKMMVVACNTATAAALPALQAALPFPVIGVIEPGARA